MTVTLKIEGMMCGHCEAHVRQALERLEGVTAVEVSHTTGTARVMLSREVPAQELRQAVEAQGYTVTAVE